MLHPPAICRLLIREKEVLAMTEKRVFRSDTFVNRSFVAGIPFILMFGGLTHFAFAWLGKTNWAAPFVPVNESVWEHLKMSYWTTFLWFFFIFLFFGKRYRLSSSRWLLAGIVSMLFCLLFIFGIISGQLLASRTYRYVEPHRIRIGMAVALWLILALAFVLFTFQPPVLPLFLDTPTGSYGF